MEAYSLFDLNQHLRRVLALNFSEPVWVEAEIAQCGSSRGHFYLELIQKSTEDEQEIIAQASAVLWAGQSRKIRKNLGNMLDSLLQDGVATKVQVQLDFHERYGLKLVVIDIDPSYTLGQLALQRQKILDRLKAESLLELNQQIPLPSVVQRIAVISSERAAGYADFQQQLRQNPFEYAYDLHFFPAAMQGKAVEKEISTQLKKIRRSSIPFDAVAIMRGGGAKLDLNAFDNYILGKAIAEFPIPVLVGIGHEIDETILDLVAHKSLKTPTALADYFIFQNEIFEAEVNHLGLILQQLVHQQTRNEALLLQRLEQEIPLLATNLTTGSLQRIDFLEQQLILGSQNSIQQAQDQLSRFDLVLQLLDHQFTLDRGYAQVQSPDGTPVRESGNLKEKDLIQIQFAKGSGSARIEKINPEK